jgi:hypothetical protein
MSDGHGFVASVQLRLHPAGCPMNTAQEYGGVLGTAISTARSGHGENKQGRHPPSQEPQPLSAEHLSRMEARAYDLHW